eukprot:scaffold15456_cov45-Attheya_sp.AAC.4
MMVHCRCQLCISHVSAASGPLISAAVVASPVALVVCVIDASVPRAFWGKIQVTLKSKRHLLESSIQYLYSSHSYCIEHTSKFHFLTSIVQIDH